MAQNLRVVQGQGDPSQFSEEISLVDTFGNPWGDGFDRRGQGQTSLQASLPGLSTAVRTYNDATAPVLRGLGLGSSVGVGATLPDPATQAPVAKFYAALAPVLNRLGNLNLAFYNGSVNGSVISEAASAHYAAAKTAAGGVPSWVLFAYGMNEGMPFHFHSGQTYPFVYTSGRSAISKAHADGADVVLMTTPHPHTVRTPWTAPGSWAYPVASPAALVPPAGAAGSVRQVESPSGELVPASYRHLRVNEAIRQLALDTGSVLIDVEKYWFDAVAQFGEDYLFDAGEYAHPNLTGHQLSYWAAIDDFALGLLRPNVLAAGAAVERNVIDWKNRGERQINIASDANYVFQVPASTAGELTVWGTSGGGWHSVWTGAVVASASRVAVVGSGSTFTNPGNLIVGVTGSATTLDVTVDTANTGSGGQLAWNYRYFTP